MMPGETFLANAIPYSWRKTEYANPGAMNYAFVPNMTLPVHAIQGGGNLQLDSYRVLTPNYFVTLPTVPVAGYGGLVQGQFIGQPLTD